MAIVFSRLTGTFNGTFQFGKGGVKVKTSSGSLSVRDAGDANPATLIALSTKLGTSTGNAVIKAPNAAEVNFRDAADAADAAITVLSAKINNNAVVKAANAAEVNIRNAADSADAKVTALSATINGNAQIKATNAAEVNLRNAADSADAKVTALSATINGNAQIKSTTGGIINFRNGADNADAKIIAGEIQTLSTGLHFDSHGYIKDGGTDGILLVTLEDGTTPGVIRVGSPTNGNDAVNLTYFNANVSSSAAQIRKASIASGGYATSYTGATTVPDNAVITRCVVDVLLALDATITIKVGTDEVGQTERFQATTDNDSQIVSSYETTPFVTMKTSGSSSTQKLLITLSSLPTVGTVNVYVEYLIPQAW